MRYWFCRPSTVLGDYVRYFEQRQYRGRIDQIVPWAAHPGPFLQLFAQPWDGLAGLARQPAARAAGCLACNRSGGVGKRTVMTGHCDASVEGPSRGFESGLAWT
jgi:hypothetical protein